MTQAENPTPPRDAIKVTRKDLPLSCPRAGDNSAGMHPRVYLPIEKSGTATCPYCGARYQLSE